MGEKSERGESLEAPGPVIEPRPAFQIPRFSLPRLRYFDRADEERQGSDGSQDAMPASQQIDTQGNSDAARGTPLDTTEASPPPDLADPEIDAPDLSALKQMWLGASTSARESFLAWIEVIK